MMHIKDSEISPERLRDVMVGLFPKLSEAGGYELLSCVGNKRVLVAIDGLYSPENIKARTGQGRIYVRPIQNTLNMDPEQHGKPADSGLKERCKICQDLIPVNVLKQHFKDCSGTRATTGPLTAEPSTARPLRISPSTAGPSRAGQSTDGPSTSRAGPSTAGPSRTGSSTAGSSRSGSSTAGPSRARSSTAGLSSGGPSTSGLTRAGPLSGEPSTAGPSRTGPPTAGPSRAEASRAGPSQAGSSTAGPSSAGSSASHSSSYRQYCSLLIPSDIDFFQLSDSDDDDLTVAILRSLEDNKPTMTASDLFKSLRAVTLDSPASLFNISRVRKRGIWEGAVRGLKQKSFHPDNRISVMFTDSIGQAEGAIDVGGPRREFFSLVLGYIQNSNIFEGPITKRVLSMNSSAMADDSYFYAGQLMAMSLVHGGPSPTFISTTLYEAIAYGYSKSTAGLDDVADRDIQSKLVKIQLAKSIEDLEAAVGDAEDLLTIAGVQTHNIKIENKNQLVSSGVRFYVLDRTRSAFERLLCGLESLKVLDTIREHPVACRIAFLHDEDLKLTSVSIRDLFLIMYSEKGGNKRNREELIISFWLDFLMDVEEGLQDSSFSLKDILVFASGTPSVPVCFGENPSIEFLEEPNIYPTANTCSVVLRLPTFHTEYEQFKEAMIFGISNSPAFGVA